MESQPIKLARRYDPSLNERFKERLEWAQKLIHDRVSPAPSINIHPWHSEWKEKVDPWLEEIHAGLFALTTGVENIIRQPGAESFAVYWNPAIPAYVVTSRNDLAGASEELAIRMIWEHQGGPPRPAK